MIKEMLLPIQHVSIIMKILVNTLILEKVLSLKKEILYTTMINVNKKV